jgi:hypothetical protein
MLLPPSPAISPVDDRALDGRNPRTEQAPGGDGKLDDLAPEVASYQPRSAVCRHHRCAVSDLRQRASTRAAGDAARGQGHPHSRRRPRSGNTACVQLREITAKAKATLKKETPLPNCAQF